MDEALVQCVLLRLLQRTGNQDSDDQTVDGNDTRHDDGDDGLHDQLGSHHRHGGNTGTGLGRSIGSSEGAEDDGSGRSHDAEEGRVDGVFLSENHFDKVLLAAVLFRVAAMECVE